VRAGPVLVFVGGCAYSLIAASTTPFTLPADVLTGAAIVAMAVAVFVRWPLRASAGRASRVGRAGREAPEGPSPPASRRSSHPYTPWLVFLSVFVVWELFNYVVHGSRSDHPTFSSITDAIDRFYLLKSLLFLGWLVGAWFILRRGSRLRKVAP
jgi:hypothetical protein